MTKPSILRRSVDLPARTSGWFVMGLGLVVATFAALGASVPILVLATAPGGEVAIATDEPSYLAPAVEIALAPESPIVETMAPPAAAEIYFAEVVDGTSYLMIEPLLDPAVDIAPLPPTTRAPKLLGSMAEPRGAVAPIDLDAAPALRDWVGRAILFDNGCRARVESLAVITLMTGGLDYMSVEDHAKENVVAETMMRDGQPHLAAVLDGCDGRFAYAAERSAPIMPTSVDDPALNKKARARLLASPAAKAANAQWRAAEHKGSWTTDSWTEFDVRAYRHPRTGVTTVSVIANADVGCGGADIQLWSVFEVASDGELVERFSGAAEQLFSIDTAVDRDGDGTLEWMGTSQLGDRVLVEVTGSTQRTLTRLQIPFFGCPC